MATVTQLFDSATPYCKLQPRVALHRRRAVLSAMPASATADHARSRLSLVSPNRRQQGICGAPRPVTPADRTR